MTAKANKAVQTLKELIATKEMMLEGLRVQFDVADANDFTNQTIIAQKISKVVVELEAYKVFLTLLEVKDV